MDAGNLDQRLLVDAELLAQESLMLPIKFLFQTPLHPRVLRAYKIAEMYTGLKGQWRIKLVDGVGRVSHFDRDDIDCVGLARVGSYLP